MDIKKPAETAAIVNPLHQYASYTYSWSLWWLDPSDYNALMNSLGPEEALSFKPTSSRSFVVAQDSGSYLNNRQPGTNKLNYHIQNVQFDTIIAPNRTSRSSNTIRGSMTIAEPYGVTLIETLVAASFDGTVFNNYCDNPYMLHLEFFGYDDNGDPIPKGTSDIVTYNKRFPIKILTMKLEVTTRGTEYKIDFVPAGAAVHQSTLYSTTPEQFNITADTVEAFFNGENGLGEQWQAFQQTLTNQKNATLADGIFFNIDPTIGISKIVNETKVSLAKANPKAKDIQLNKTTFTIPKGTPILDIITKVMAHSDFLIQKQLGLEVAAANFENPSLFDPTTVFNAFKTTTKLEYGGIDNGGQRQGPAIDLITNRYPKIVTYNIHQYSIWNAKHPAPSLLTNSYPYTNKYYNYIYTGLNTDIVDLKINFDTTYYTAILAFTNAKAAEDSTKDTDVAVADDNRVGKAARVALNPAIFTKIFPQLASISTVTPLQYQFVVDDVRVTSLMNVKDRPGAQVAADVLKSIYTAQNQEMLKLDLTIVGDPTLLKQDDWLYVPDPRDDTDFSQWDIGSDTYCQRYGHIPMDRGQVAVRVIINSPIDMDLDYEDGNQGLAYPDLKYSQSLFSGQYIIVSITNKFANGKFEQVLNLARIMGDEIPTAFERARNGDGRNPVGVGSRIDKELTQTNPSQPAGDGGNNTPLPPGMTAEERDAAVANAYAQPLTVQVNGSRGDPRP
jgi:hypothetical protein